MAGVGDMTVPLHGCQQWLQFVLHG